MSKTIIKISVVAALVLISVILFSGQALPRLYNTATLFDKDKIVHNFSNMKDVALTIEIKSSSEPYLFSSQPQALPESFQYGGNVVSTEEFLKRSDTTALVVLKNEDIT
ncbi:MAG: serine hydrolase, partial [Oleispira antarctica]|nr:serine hydrolase [Oleispira antarctica]